MALDPLNSNSKSFVEYGLCAIMYLMKSSQTKIVLTPAQKAAAKSNSLQSMLTSFRIEGVRFTPRQIASVKSRLHFSK